MSEPLIVERATLAAAGRTLMRDVSFRVEAGERLAIMGPSGSGKSSLLAYIGGHLDHAFAASGRVFMGEREVTDLAPEYRRIGLMFQDDLLFPHLNVGANLAFGLDYAVRERTARRARVAEALAEAGLAGFANRDPSTLSGGQRQRVALMRSLLSAPQALLLDEPFGKLDSHLRAEIRRFVFDHAARASLPVVIVTHDPADAEAAGGRTLILAGASHT